MTEAMGLSEHVPNSLPVRLLVLSDLHLDFAPFTTPDPATFDIAILAGDIFSGPKAIQWAKRDSAFGGKPVVLVPGNHEFYGSERNRTLEIMRERADGSNVHVLDRDEVELLGVRFLGTTLWTDFALNGGDEGAVVRAMHEATHGLNDFSGLIRERPADGPAHDRFTPQVSLREHEASRAWLSDRLQENSAARTVVITHHAPSSRSMAAIYAGSRLNPCFYSDLPETFFRTPKLWIHGHTHSSADYAHHETRIVANPRGYVSWAGKIENSSFDPALVITI